MNTRLTDIIQFIKQNKKSDRAVILVSFFGLDRAPTTLLRWNEIESRQPIYFDVSQASIVFSHLLFSYGEAVGFCQESQARRLGRMPSDIHNNGLSWGNLPNDHFRAYDEGMATGLPKVRNLSFGKCISIESIFTNDISYELEAKVDGALDYREEIFFRGKKETGKELLAELLYPIVTLGVGDIVTHEFIEAFIGWFQREDI